MYITLEELLHADFFATAVVAAGRNGIGNCISSFNILENENGYEFTDKNMLVLTSGDFFKFDAEEQKRVIDVLHLRDTAGLLLNGTYLSENDIPASTKALADRYGFPIVLLPGKPRPFREFFHFYDSYIFAKGTKEFIHKSRISAFFLHKINEKGVNALCEQLHLYTGRYVIFQFQDSVNSFPDAATPLYEAVSLGSIRAVELDIADHPGFLSAEDDLQAIGQAITYQGRRVGTIWMDTAEQPYDDNDLYFLEAARLAGELNIQQLFFYNENAAKLRNYLTTKLLQGKATNMNDLMLLARGVNWQIPSALRLVAVSVQPLNTLRPYIHKAIRDFSQEHHVSLQAQNYQDAIILFMPDDKNDFRQDMEALLTVIRESTGNPDILIGIGSRVGIMDSALSLRQALFTIEIEKKTNIGKTGMCYDDAGIYRLCFPDTCSPELTTICRRILAPLFEMDASSKLNLIETLSTYFANNCCYTDTAKMLFVHPNTIRYRLGLVEETLHINLNRYSDMMELHMALKLLPLMELSSGMTFPSTQP